ncbi:MAG: CO dehydrogenase/CO-methylating acetyl-CoA synthase complex subunit beta [Methanocellales archaeon]|nr:CO dehydrogenase/CO-methylating acetyl-CoA synthase complex subunit beta [Methanocellales archaeon]
MKIPVDVSVVHEGERIRKEDMYVELGGPKVSSKGELVRVRKPGEIRDGNVEVEGPDFDKLKEGGRYPFAIFVEVAGKNVEEDLEAVIERRIHDYCNYVEGFMHLNQRYDIWCRLSKKSYERGFNTLKYLGQALITLFKAELPIIEKIQVTFITDEKKVEAFVNDARKIYEARDARARALSEEEVDTFYGCVLCQSFAPTHFCVITPDRISLCGSINWFDGRAAARVDPKGPNFAIPKGELIDEVNGEYSGVNKVVKERSQGETERFYLHSIFNFPHTSCGCFESIAFYIPEVDGVGVVHRDYIGETVLGVPFSTLATQTGGGKQVEGFLGMAIEYMRSPKFLQADGGWNRMVWLPKSVKERVIDDIPAELRDKIATEEDATDIAALKGFLKERGHPVVERWREVEAVEVPELEVMPVGAPGGIKIILQNAKIHAEKVIIKKIK